MLSKKGIYLKNLIENHGSTAVCGILQAAFDAGEIRANDFSIKQLAEATMGEDWVARLNEAEGTSGGMQLLESDPAGVDSTAFANITGQIVYNAVREGYSTPGMVGDKIVTVIPTTFHDGEKISGVTEPLGEASDVKEGMPFPEMGMTEDYINTPATVKRGNIVSVTKEAIAKDRTGTLLMQAAKVGERVRLKKENAILDMVLGITNPFSWRGTAYNTYLTSGGWVNDAASSELLDWTSLENIAVALSNITNPFQTDSNEPVPYRFTDLLVMPFKEYTARRILSATEVRAVSNTNNTTLSGSPVPQLNLLSSALAVQRLILSGVSAANAKQYYVGGDFKKAFGYMEVYGLTLTQQNQTSDASFERDVVLRYKAAERGVPVVLEPRAVQRRYVS